MNAAENEGIRYRPSQLATSGSLMKKNQDKPLDSQTFTLYGSSNSRRRRLGIAALEPLCEENPMSFLFHLGERRGLRTKLIEMLHWDLESTHPRLDAKMRKTRELS